MDAWISLGNCFWKKGDLLAAKNCFVECQEYGSSRKAVRCLSMLLRQMGSNPEEKSANIHLSLVKAKEALKLDITDGESWCKSELASSRKQGWGKSHLARRR